MTAEAQMQVNVVDLYPCTRGKRVVYITNRADNALNEELTRSLQARTFKFAVVPPDAPKRLGNAVESIQAGSWDAVLLVEAFTSHSVYDALVRACAAAATPTRLVLVGKGRVHEVMRELTGVQLRESSGTVRVSTRHMRVRWQGAEIARIEDLALAGKTDEEIMLALRTEFDVARSLVSVQKVKTDLGIVKGKRVREPRNMPQGYDDFRQAQRIRRELQPAPAPMPEPAPMLEPAPVAPPVPQPTPPPVELPAAAVAVPIAQTLAQKPKSSTTMVTIIGSRGQVLIETRRPLSEIVDFLIGDV